jgi:hypothetical protein
MFLETCVKRVGSKSNIEFGAGNCPDSRWRFERRFSDPVRIESGWEISERVLPLNQIESTELPEYKRF